MPKARTTPRFSRVLAWLGSMRERALELRERPVGLVRVVVGHAQIGADVGVAGVEVERRLVPADGVGIALGVEVQVAELRPARRVARRGVGLAVSSSTRR